jgi:hypothetical protein
MPLMNSPRLATRVAFQPVGDGCGPPAVAHHDQDGVVTGDGADGAGEMRPVDRKRERLGLSGARMNDDELLHPIDANEKLRRRAFECRQCGLAIVRLEAGPLVGAVPGSLHQPELRDVPRDGRLSGLEALPSQPEAELLLASERVLIDEPENRRLAPRLHGTSGYTIRCGNSEKRGGAFLVASAL